MIKSIISGISNALHEEFGDKYRIYAEHVEQGFKEPSFFILCINPENELFLERRYFRTHKFCVHYFPQDILGKREEIYSVLERLYGCLEYITVDKDLIRGNNMENVINDGVLQFFINYDLFVYKSSDKSASMENIGHDLKMKG